MGRERERAGYGLDPGTEKEGGLELAVLKGGVRYAKGREPKGTMAKRVRRKKLPFGAGWTGQVREVELEIPYRKSVRTRKVRMVEKEFYPGLVDYNPLRQFKVMAELLELNRKKKLGLRLTPTIRLLERRGKQPTLILTKLNVLRYSIVRSELSYEQETEFDADVARQKRILESNGYHASKDCFFPAMDQTTRKCVAILGDFQHVSKTT